MLSKHLLEQEIGKSIHYFSKIAEQNNLIFVLSILYSSMINCFRTIFILLLLPSFLFSTTFGQLNSPVDSVSSFSNTIAFFQQTVGPDVHLFTGKEYVNYPAGIKSHPFFETDQMRYNEIFYDGSFYTSIPMLYDIVKQELIIDRPGKDVPMQLVSEKIKYFSQGGHKFQNMPTVIGKEEVSTSTIYEIILDGDVGVLAKRIKNIKKGMRPEDPSFFGEEDEFFIRNNKTLYPVSNKNDVLQAFSNKKAQVKSFIRKNSFKFKKKIEQELVATTTFYVKLN
jgi:hypothetical protein